MRRIAVAVAIVTLTWLAGAQRSAFANPADAYGFAARGPGMGGALTAGVDDASANYYNPAALATLSSLSVGLGYQYVSHQLNINDLDQEVTSSRGSALSFSTPGKFLGRRVAIGGGFYIPDNHLTRTRTLAVDTPRFSLYDNRPQRLYLSANLAVEITKRIFVGVGMQYISRPKGGITVAGRVGFPVADDSDLDLNIDVDLLTIRTQQVGVLIYATPWLKLGATYRGGFELVIDQTFTIAGDVGPPDAPVVIEDAFLALSTVSQDHFQPATFTVGAHAQLTPRLAMAFDMAWFQWSKFPNPAAVVELAWDLKDFNSLFDIPGAPKLPDLNYSDIVVPRIGFEYLAATSKTKDILVRAGYSFEPSPVPEQVGQTNHIDNDKHTVSVGGTYTMKKWSSIVPRPASFDAYFAFTKLSGRSHRKLSPVDPIGDYQSSGQVFQLGVASRWSF